MTIIVFVLLLIGGPPHYEVLDSVVFKHNMATLEECEEVQELLQEKMEQNMLGEMVHSIRMTPCYEMEINEKTSGSL